VWRLVVLDRFQGRLHRAAFLVTDHHDQRSSQVTDGVLDTAQQRGVDDVAGDPRHEQVAKTLIEQQLGRQP
jgi:hypothetical protein